MTSPDMPTALNGICPYFTMFPLRFPFDILRCGARPGESVLDPFCGRGTTNFAARLLGLRTLGVDTSPVAAAVTAAKLVRPEASGIVAEARKILTGTKAPDIPAGDFWERCYHPETLSDLCRFRTALGGDCSSDARIALQGIVLGALHGPRQKTVQSYFSNQCPRTYAPKPSYAARYWKERALRPPRVDTLDIVRRRAERYYSGLSACRGEVRLADSRRAGSLRPGRGRPRFSWVITSPPYYGMRTYVPDQWLRYWFLGGPDRVDYAIRDQMAHTCPDDFVRDLGTVWTNAAEACKPGATMVVRFGGIAARNADPRELAQASLQDSPWRLVDVRSAGTARKGRRQADAFLRNRNRPAAEFDYWASLT